LLLVNLLYGCGFSVLGDEVLRGFVGL